MPELAKYSGRCVCGTMHIKFVKADVEAIKIVCPSCDILVTMTKVPVRQNPELAQANISNMLASLLL